MAHLGRINISQAQKHLMYGLAGVGITAGIALLLQPQVKQALTADQQILKLQSLFKHCYANAVKMFAAKSSW